MADRKVKVGIIGCGVIANLTHGPEYERLKDQVEVIAACDIDPQALASFCERFHIPRRYSTIAEMLGDPDIEAVDVCLHNNMQRPGVHRGHAAGEGRVLRKAHGGLVHRRGGHAGGLETIRPEAAHPAGPAVQRRELRGQGAYRPRAAGAHLPHALHRVPAAGAALCGRLRQEGVCERGDLGGAAPCWTWGCTTSPSCCT